MFNINIDKAKDITKNRLRVERNSLFVKLDANFMRAIESGLPTDEIVSEKQRLRDITNLADTVTTLDELKKIKA